MITETQTRPPPAPLKRVVMQAPRGPARPLAVLLVGGALVAGASGPTYAAGLDWNRVAGSTAFVISRQREDCVPLADIMAELKLKTGLTWDQLGDFLSVSRKTIHNWAKGSAITSDHREEVEGLLDRVRELADLRPFEIRRMLLGSTDRMKIPAASEPAILFADQRRTDSPLSLRKGTSLRVVRRNGASG
jgi:hypothetical protein